MEAWREDKERTVRAAVLRHLLIADEWPVDAKGVRLRGVRISGLLDLKAATLRCPLSLDSCYLDASEPVCLDHAEALHVTLSRCWLRAGLTGEMLIARDLTLSRSIFTGPLRLAGASLTGGLNCGGARLITHDKYGYALWARGIKVGADVDLDEGFTAFGAVRLAGADITGRLRCSGATLTGRDRHGYAMSASGIKVGGDVDLDEGFTALGAVRLAGADITGRLRCSGATLTGRDNDGNALSARGIKVGDDVQLDEGFTAFGAVRLVGANITGTLRCSGATLTGRDQNGNALHGERMKVGGDVLFDEAFIASGAVCLVSADITGQLSCGGARLTGVDKNGIALHGEGIKVGSDVCLNAGFIAGGAISLASAHAGALRWAPGEQVCWSVDLEGADVDQLEDDWTGAIRKKYNGYWPAGGRLHLDGFTYRRLGGRDQATVTERLDWIRSQYRPRPTARWKNPIMAVIKPSHVRTAPPDFTPGPYEQLAAVYRQAGQDSEARKVAIFRRADLRKYGKLNPYRWVGNWFLGLSIGYGYRTWRAGLVLIAVFTLFALLACFAQQHHLMVPVGDTKGLPVSAAKCTSSYPCFYPIGYTIDTVIPVINVHQAAYWGPDGSAPLGQAWVAATWIATGLGWALATLLVAGYTGLVRRD